MPERESSESVTLYSLIAISACLLLGRTAFPCSLHTSQPAPAPAFVSTFSASRAYLPLFSSPTFTEPFNSGAWSNFKHVHATTPLDVACLLSMTSNTGYLNIRCDITPLLHFRRASYQGAYSCAVVHHSLSTPVASDDKKCHDPACREEEGAYRFTLAVCCHHKARYLMMLLIPM